MFPDKNTLKGFLETIFQTIVPPQKKNQYSWIRQLLLETEKYPGILKLTITTYHLPHTIYHLGSPVTHILFIICIFLLIPREVFDDLDIPKGMQAMAQTDRQTDRQTDKWMLRIIDWTVQEAGEWKYVGTDVLFYKHTHLNSAPLLKFYQPQQTVQKRGKAVCK